MLGKLIKHEWKSTYKICGALLLFLVVMTGLATISFKTPMWGVLFAEKQKSGFVPTPLDFAGLMSLLFYVLSMVGVIWAIIIYLGVHFYKTMYSEEGYLTHTLPVTSHQLLCSKILTAGIWYLIVLLVMILSIFCLAFALIGTAFHASTEGMNLWKVLAEHWDEIAAEFHKNFRFSMMGNVAVYAAMLIFGSFTSVTSLFGAVTVGQLFGKHKVMMSIVSYFGISMITNVITSIVSMPVTISSTRKMFENPSSQVNLNLSGIPSSLISIAVSVVVAVILYFISNYIITKKLNLD